MHIEKNIFLEPVSNLGKFERKLALNVIEYARDSFDRNTRYQIELLTFGKGSFPLSGAKYKRIKPFYSDLKVNHITCSNELKTKIGIRWESQSPTGKTYTPESDDFEVFEAAYKKMLELGFKY
jgi:hypothetical protein